MISSTLAICSSVLADVGLIEVLYLRELTSMVLIFKALYKAGIYFIWFFNYKFSSTSTLIWDFSLSVCSLKFIKAMVYRYSLSWSS